ncbi:MAG: cache domain-containing protein, partial [Smithellaceae bacterium]
PETKKDKKSLPIAGVFFLLIVIPLSLMAFLIANGMFKLGVTIKERTVNVLDQKSQEEIKSRAINTADDVANFLMEVKKDVLVATILPATETAFKQFVLENKKPLWVKDENRVRQMMSPLYKEMTLTDRQGNEIIKISNGQAVPSARLKNVSNPANTTYKSEDYFSKTRNLNKGQVYVSTVIGNYISKEAFEKGERFSGIVRFATPVFSAEGFAGMITLALDYRHLARFTRHLIPTQIEQVYEVNAATGNYSYMVDSSGFIITHPNDYHIRGIATDGNFVQALTENNAEGLTQKGIEVLNLKQLGFMDPNLPVIAKEAALGKSGILTYQFGGITKFVAYAPIKFEAANLKGPAGFGWIGMSVEVEKYNEAASSVSQNIEKEAKAWTAAVIFIIIASMIILFGIMWLLVRGITRSLLADVPEGSQGELTYDDDDDDK